MAATTKDNTFTTNVTSEASSPLIAGMVSFNGLIPLFGTTGANGVTSETESGLMTVPTLNNWISRLASTSFSTSGPTGSWAGEWWAVHNYLQYGGSCIIGGTGSTGDYYSPTGVLTASNTPLHNKSLVDLNVIFDSGITKSAEAAISIATTRQDCLAIIGNYKKLSGVPGLAAAYSTKSDDFGFTLNSEFVAYVAGRKKFVAGVGNNINILEANLSPDVAGCMARSARDSYIWAPPAGKTRGRILGVISMQQTFSETDLNYIYAGNVNPITVFPGEGTFLMGNKTSGSGTLERLNVSNLVIYIKKEVLKIAQGLLFEINDSTTRQRMVSESRPILDSIKSSGGITNYRIVCDETNNTAAIIAQNKMVVDVYIQPTNTTETIQVTIINTNSSQAF